MNLKLVMPQNWFKVLKLRPGNVVWIVLLIIGVCACNSAEDTRLYGRWQQVGRDVSIEFRPFRPWELGDIRGDGKYAGVVVVDCIQKMQGVFEWIDSNRITLYLHLADIDCEDEINTAETERNFGYQVIELSDTRMVLRTLQAPFSLTEYQRINGN